MTTKEKVMDLVSWETANDFSAVDLVMEWGNCKQASIDNGAIWICDPQVGHWLSEIEIEEFLAWVETQKNA